MMVFVTTIMIGCGGFVSIIGCVTLLMVPLLMPTATPPLFGELIHTVTFVFCDVAVDDEEPTAEFRIAFRTPFEEIS